MRNVVAVLMDPRTERLEHPGLHLEQLPGYRPEGYEVEQLAASFSDRQELTDGVLAAQHGLVSIVTPPYFFGRDERSTHLNLALAEAAQHSSDVPVRPVVALKSRTAAGLVSELAQEYGRAGSTQIDLRFSPLGGEGDSIVKVRSVFAANEFTSRGIAVTLGPEPVKWSV